MITITKYVNIFLYTSFYDFSQIPPSIGSVPCSPEFRKCPQPGKAVYCFDCTSYLENEITNMTDKYIASEKINQIK